MNLKKPWASDLSPWSMVIVFFPLFLSLFSSQPYSALLSPSSLLCIFAYDSCLPSMSVHHWILSQPPTPVFSLCMTIFCVLLSFCWISSSMISSRLLGILVSLAHTLLLSVRKCLCCAFPLEVLLRPDLLTEFKILPYSFYTPFDLVFPFVSIVCMGCT